MPEQPVLPPAEPASGTFGVAGGTFYIGDGTVLRDGSLLVEDGRITAVGPRSRVEIPAGVRTYEAQGGFVTPGIIDTHSHMGVYAQPNVAAHADGNELTDPTTPYVFSEHGFWPQDPAIQAAVVGGVTTAQILPGSGNVIGGRAVVLKLRPRREARAMRFPGAPMALKMACGENPKRLYGAKGKQPASRMGNIFKLRQAFIRAREYRLRRAAEKQAYTEWKENYDRAQQDPNAAHPGPEPDAKPRDLGLETLAAVLDGTIKVHIHCYRADEMLLMLALADELGFEVGTFHHAVEAYKIADVLAKRGVHAAVWADWWGFKLEAYDATEANAAILSAAGARPNIHSDSPIGGQRLNQEAAKALFEGRRMGLDIDDGEAIQWITLNPAMSLGIADQTGSLTEGKMADLVIWDRDPLSVYARTTHVFIDGALVFDRSAEPERWSDFLVGTAVEETTP